MSEQSHRLIAVDIVNVHIVSVVANSFIRNNQLFVPILLVSHHSDIRISDVKFRLQFQKEIEVFGLLFVESNKENTHFALMFVCKEVYMV